MKTNLPGKLRHGKKWREFHIPETQYSMSDILIEHYRDRRMKVQHPDEVNHLQRIEISDLVKYPSVICNAWVL